jgi:predicted nucleic acid-binding protein
MKKKKIYLDTSVISYLDQQDVPVEMQQTLELWDVFKTGTYDIVISEMTLFEIQNCSSEKQKVLFDYLEQIVYQEFHGELDARRIANEIIQEEILSQSHFEDCYHIASAILSRCDMLLSWNFRHLVRPKTINGIKELLLKSCPNTVLDICAPLVLLPKKETAK